MLALVSGDRSLLAMKSNAQETALSLVYYVFAHNL